MVTARKLPYRHLSVRVPWHDTSWEGSVCADPLANGSCLRLGRIAEGRDDAQEARLAGKSWAELAEGGYRLPPCSSERAGFMSPHARRVTKEHPYSAWNEVYRKFGKASFELPAYSADCVPFRWMLREEAAQLAERYQLPYEPALEEAVDAKAGLRSPDWVQHEANQRMLLDSFFSAIEKERSLFFVYAKESPVSVDPRRILIGVGRVLDVGQVAPYPQNAGGFGSVLWERVVRHSIRPAATDGFLLPYQQLLALGDKSGTDPQEYAVFVPDEATAEFSYASEHVSHDTALSLLLDLERMVATIAKVAPGSWDTAREWLNARVAEVWQARGPYPGLGAALTAFGISEGVLLAHAIQSQARDDNDDPWQLVDRWLRAPSGAAEAVGRVSAVMSRTWAGLDDRRRTLLRLLSRFDLSIDQATLFYQPTERDKAGLDLSDEDLLANPYLIYEHSRLSPDPVGVRTIDHGVFPEDRIRTAHPLAPPSAVDDAVDPRRVRALIVDVLEDAAGAGDTLRSQARVIQEIRDQPLQPACPVSLDIMGVCAEALPPEVETAAMADGSAAYQLARLGSARRQIARQVTRRRGAAPLKVSADWRYVIDQALGGVTTDDEEEELARQEKAAALEMLATSRVSVLIGAAGTGKTTLLRALLSLPEIAGGGLLLLAPTGKARVRMQKVIGNHANTQAQTLAQLLVKTGRYDPDTSRYQRSDRDRESSARTVIVDECSMLTEDALDALLDGIEGFDRLILVGDPRQLPPIGAGRPFVDIVHHLRTQCGPLGFPRVGPSYAELTVPRRHTGAEPGERADLLLAEWFAGGEPSPGSDEVWEQLGRGDALPAISVLQWSTPADLDEIMRDTLADTIRDMSSAEDSLGFQLSYGGTRSGEHVYFNLGAAKKAEEWQVLSPVRASAGGVNEINRLLQQSYRADTLSLARNEHRYARKVPKPAGPQEIVYGDKVINIRNKTRRHYYPPKPGVLEYVANGEIGVVTGPFKARGKNVPLNQLEVEFTTQQGTAYKFWLGELGGDDQAPVLELAYAVTVHKAQGSEFGQTFVILPSLCRVMSRELLYTALTRQRDHVTLLIQGQLADLRQYASAAHSETAARITNLFTAPSPVEIDGRYLEAGLIHRTRKGHAVRSKSEVIIADLLYSKHIDYQYEQPLDMPDGSRRLPDFTITDDTTGTTYYWEHLGMLQRPSYRRQWQAKLHWYKSHGILPYEDGDGSAGVLITTRDGEDGSISSAQIETLIDSFLA
jgi:hypothetical protein